MHPSDGPFVVIIVLFFGTHQNTQYHIPWSSGNKTRLVSFLSLSSRIIYLPILSNTSVRYFPSYDSMPYRRTIRQVSSLSIASNHSFGPTYCVQQRCYVGSCSVELVTRKCKCVGLWDLHPTDSRPIRTVSYRLHWQVRLSSYDHNAIAISISISISTSTSVSISHFPCAKTPCLHRRVTKCPHMYTATTRQIP